MLPNLFDQIFSRSKCGKREIITTTIIEPDSITANDDPHSNETTAMSGHCCFLPSISLSDTDDSDTTTLKSNYESQPQHKQSTIDRRSIGDDNTRQWRQQHQHLAEHLNNQNRIRNNQNKLNEISIFSVYLLFATVFVCICTIAVLLFTYINRANDIVQLRDSFTSEFIMRSDIDELIRNVLREMKNNGDDDRSSSGVSFYVDSHENIGSRSTTTNDHDIQTADGFGLR